MRGVGLSQSQSSIKTASEGKRRRSRISSSSSLLLLLLLLAVSRGLAQALHLPRHGSCNKSFSTPNSPSRKYPARNRATCLCAQQSQTITAHQSA